MIICHCFKVNSVKLIELIKKSNSMDELHENTYAGQGCGCCMPAIEELFNQIKNNKKQDGYR